MQYPKQVMRLTELMEMGFDKEFLKYVFRNQGKKGIAWKMNPTKNNSPILFDTEALERYRKAMCVGR